MPRYEFRCRACGDTFEVSRSMADASAPATCPSGHDDTVRLLSTVALMGRSTASVGGSARLASSSAEGMGGCCGGACGCG